MLISNDGMFHHGFFAAIEDGRLASTEFGVDDVGVLVPIVDADPQLKERVSVSICMRLGFGHFITVDLPF